MDILKDMLLGTFKEGGIGIALGILMWFCLMGCLALVGVGIKGLYDCTINSVSEWTESVASVEDIEFKPGHWAGKVYISERWTFTLKSEKPLDGTVWIFYLDTYLPWKEVVQHSRVTFNYGYHRISKEIEFKW